MDTLLGLTVERAIPPEVIAGLLSNRYKLYGGVIRWASGTKRAGQIVRHLLPVGASELTSPSLFGSVSAAFQVANTYQLREINIAAQQILQIATSTMALSGLNLAVSAMGFVIINQKLKNLEGQLSELQREVKAIRELLELEERAKLRAALQNLIFAMQSHSLENRRQMLFDAKNVLAPINFKYRELLSKAHEVDLAMGYEEYFSLTSLAHTRCLAELGMLDTARRNLEGDTKIWLKQARRIANEQLLGKHPERFLFSDFVADTPVERLVEWLDFAKGEDKGYARIDELRGRTNTWYSVKKLPDVKRRPKQVFSSIGKTFAKKEGNDLEIEKQKIIPSLQKLTARSNVLDGYVAQYELLEQKDVTPSQFEEEIRRIQPELAVDGYVILLPAESEKF